MLPTLTFELPNDSDWYYEVKYDGFRAIVTWDEQGIEITSRNEKPLNSLFPEIVEYLLANEVRFRPFLPLQLDGELALLKNPHKSDFSAVQHRGRMKSKEKILEHASNTPCRFLVFDLLTAEGKSLKSTPFSIRKKRLNELFLKTGLHQVIELQDSQLMLLVRAHADLYPLWDHVVLSDGEGIVCKHKQSVWEEGKRSTQWLKYKNWKHVTCFVTAFYKKNGYFEIGVYKEDRIFRIGQVLFGFKPEEKQALQRIIQQNKMREDQEIIWIKPAICLEVTYLEVYKQELREPHFYRFRFEVKPVECTFQQFQSQIKNLPASVELTHPDKPIWGQLSIQKADFLNYLREASPLMLPFLKDRLLTVIRYPHGMDGEPFYQKNCPEYAPEFIQTHLFENNNYIVCNDIRALLWLGNQLAIEFHLPFQTIRNSGPSEIVFDLDPPSQDDFQLAVKAALEIKTVLDQLNLVGFIKTSGNKGLQIYIPLPDNTFSFNDTRKFTRFIADFLVSSDPDSFTIERLKKKRGKRLYIDYVQHAEGKTIVAPYSLRGNSFAGAAAPLFWEEINRELKVEMFTMTTVLERIRSHMNPFAHYFETKKFQPFSPVLDFLNKKKG